jgi:hypothetical protein
MIRTLSTASTSTSCSPNEHSPPPSSSTRARRFTLHSLATRLSDSKKTFLDQIPQHQQQLTRLRKRAKSFLSSTLIDQISVNQSPRSDRRNSANTVYRKKI